MRILALALAISIYGEAVLPPLWQDAAEITALFNHSALGDYLPSGEPIEKIVKQKEGWRVETTRHAVDVTVIPLPQSMPGPKKFDLQFKNP